MRKLGKLYMYGCTALMTGAILSGFVKGYRIGVRK